MPSFLSSCVIIKNGIFVAGRRCAVRKVLLICMFVIIIVYVAGMELSFRVDYGLAPSASGTSLNVSSLTGIGMDVLWYGDGNVSTGFGLNVLISSTNTVTAIASGTSTFIMDFYVTAIHRVELKESLDFCIIGLGGPYTSDFARFGMVVKILGGFSWSWENWKFGLFMGMESRLIEIGAATVRFTQYPVSLNATLQF